METIMCYTGTESAVVNMKKTHESLHISFSCHRLTIRHRSVNTCSAVQPTKAAASESLFSSLNPKFAPGNATDNY